MQNHEQEIGCWDAVLLESLTEDSFINNLHQRYKRDYVYTYIGTFLVAVNPFKPLSIYSPDQVKLYANKSLFKLPPHIYGLTNSAYQWLQDHNEDQCIILSGESNSGKTETSRLIVHFLSQVSEARRSAAANSHNLTSRRPLYVRQRSSSAQPSRHSSPSSVASSSKSHIILAKSSSERGSLLKQRSVDLERTKKCSHEKTVEFDFSRHKSTENLPTSSSLINNKCQKHHYNTMNPSASNIIVQNKQCSVHNLISTATTATNTPLDKTKLVQIDSCLKKPTTSNCDNFQTNAISHSAKHHPLNKKQNPFTSNTNYLPIIQSNNVPMKQLRNCARCGHQNCAAKSSVLAANGTSVFNSIKCNNCDSVGDGFKQPANLFPPNSSKKILKSLTAIRQPVNEYKSISSLDISAGSSGNIYGGGSLNDVYELCKIRDRIAQADVFLEAIGNAMTMKNFNSSRYGKYFDIEFDFKGDPISGHVTHYMLEKSRITSKKPGERNFHIFYQLLSGADIQFLKSLKLQRNIDKYELLNHGNATDDDKQNFFYTKKSLETLGLSQDEIFSIFKIIAVVIKLGNLVFVPITNIDGSVGCHVSNEYELLETAQLLNIDAQILLSCLTRADSNWIQVDNGPELDATNATQTKNVLCRTLYGRLFTWTVSRINDALKSKTCMRGKMIGVLDFYGFENMETNSFEQLAINYCDERLHQHLLQNILKYQQDSYIREGLEWARLDYFDNETICELIDKPNYGILNLLDEPHISCDDTLLLRMQQCCAGHPNFLSQDTSAMYRCFQIRHFAGPVVYSVNGFLEKNSDILIRNISSGLFQSKLPIVQSLFPEGNPKRSSRRPTSLGSNLRTQLQTLLSSIDNRKIHYVFCVKPNEHHQCRQFELPLVQHQVRYMSLMPLVSLWRTGHCFNITHSKFLHRYKLLNFDTWPHFTQGSCVEGVALIIHGVRLPAAEFTIGTRKVFIRSPRTVFELEEFRRLRLDDLACLIQKTFRCYSKRKLFLTLRNSQIIIASAWRTWRECRFGIPFTGRRHLWGLYRVAREEYRIMKYRKQVEWAICVIQRQYVQWKRRQFLITLPLRLPADSFSPLCIEWAVAPRFLTETSQLLRNIYHRWRCYKYRRTFDQTARNRMREKVTASIIFRDRKSSYARSVSHPFLGDYVRLRQNVQWKKICVESNDQYVVFADIINKIARSSGKFVPILLVLSTSSMLLLDQRTLQIKYRVPATEIYRLSLSPFLDDIAVFHVKAEYNTSCSTQHMCSEAGGCLFQSEMGRKKGDFVFQTGHVIEIVTKLFLVIQNATAKPPEVHISTEFEANFGQQTVVFTFKCANVADQCQGQQPKVQRKGNRMEIIV